jgi:xylulokinase
MYCGIDLGSTNIKIAIYSEDFKLIDRQSRPVEYIRENGFVEFDAVTYCQILTDLLTAMVAENGIKAIRQIAFTGQAESLVVLGADGKPLMNAISWMDERSTEECKLLEQQFPHEVCEAVTGQMAVLPTWPATKILWLQKNRPEIYGAADTYMLLKDYVVYYLTGEKKSDMSIATFSFYFDIYKKCYWTEMLDAIGVKLSQLPELVEPCSVAGTLLPGLVPGLEPDTAVNVGTLDHFAGMIGAGNILPGGVTLSTGTVMAMTVMADESMAHNTGIAMHYGFLPDTHIMLPVVESGGVSLEWFHRTCMKNVSYDEMNATLARRERNDLLFLPYMVGTNAPEFDADAKGVFWGLRQEHDNIDMAGAIMEGVAYVLQKNLVHIHNNGIRLNNIIATGGGAKSPIWCQLYADITGLPVRIPTEKEAACLGAAMIAAVADGKYADFTEASKELVTFTHEYTPHPCEHFERKFRRFCKLYDAALEINKI